MKIAIAGAGAMGSRFGYMFQKEGQDVTLIDRWKDHVAAIQRDGLKVNDNGKKQVCRIRAVFPEKAEAHYDLILIFTKAMQLAAMMDAIKPIIDGQTAVLILSNGIGNIETLEKYVARDQIYAGVTLWTSELDGPGRVTLTGSGSVVLQPVGIGSEHFLHDLVVTMNQAGLNVRVSRNVLISIWQKATLNSVLNTYCTLLSCNIRRFGRLDNAERLAEMVVNECTSVAHAEGVMIDRAGILATIRSIFDPKAGGEHFPSMYQDLHSGRKTEVDFLNGAFVRAGKKDHIPTPYNQLITELIHAEEQLFRAE
jgi:2-dehydropantoate 2-reductase